MNDSPDLLSSQRLVILLEHHSRVLLQYFLALPTSLSGETEEIEIGEDVFRSVVGEEDEELGGRRRAGKTTSDEVRMLGVVEDLHESKK